MKIKEYKEKINTFIDNVNDEELEQKGQEFLNELQEYNEEEHATGQIHAKYYDFLTRCDLVECSECGEIYLLNDTRETDRGDTICQNCIDNGNWCFCDGCGRVVSTYDIIAVDDGNIYYCQDCCNENARYCECCEQYVSSGVTDVYTSTTSTNCLSYCESCLESGEVNYCSECDTYYTYDCGEYDEDCDDWFCYSCLGGHEAQLIKNYSHKPDAEFYETEEEKQQTDKTRCYFGVEVEIDSRTRQDRARAVTDLHDILGDLFYYKNDGSLTYGFECVSHPATINYWTENKEKIKQAFESAVNNGFRSHDTSTCGFHIHTNRDYLGNTPKEQNDTINKIILILEGFKNELSKFSRRRDFHWSQFLSTDAIANNSIEQINDIKNTKVIDKVKTMCASRYKVLNLINSNTIELRVLRGTLNIDTFYAGLQLFKNIIDIAKTKTEKQINGIKWQKIINYNKKFVELREYNKKRDIDLQAVLTMTNKPKTLVIGDKVQIVNNNYNYISKLEEILINNNATGTITDYYCNDFTISLDKKEIKRINKIIKQNGGNVLTIPAGNTKYFVSIKKSNLKRIEKEIKEEGEQ